MWCRTKGFRKKDARQKHAVIWAPQQKDNRNKEARYKDIPFNMTHN